MKLPHMPPGRTGSSQLRQRVITQPRPKDDIGATQWDDTLRSKWLACISKRLQHRPFVSLNAFR